MSEPSNAANSTAAIDAKVQAMMAQDEPPTPRSFIVPTVDFGAASNERKRDLLRKNPLVPIGALVTAAVLAAGLIQFRRGNAEMSQRFMRYRVLAQGATIGVASLSVMGGTGWFEPEQPKPAE